MTSTGKGRGDWKKRRAAIRPGNPPDSPDGDDKNEADFLSHREPKEKAEKLDLKYPLLNESDMVLEPSQSDVKSPKCGEEVAPESIPEDSDHIAIEEVQEKDPKRSRVEMPEVDQHNKSSANSMSRLKTFLALRTERRF